MSIESAFLINKRKAHAYELIAAYKSDYLHLKSGANEYRISFDEIELLEAASEYIKY